MSYESHAEPIKLGYLFDFLLPDGYPEEKRLDLTRSFELVFQQAHEGGPSTVRSRSSSARSRASRRVGQGGHRRLR